jgi:hypothetical protein
MCGRTSLEVTQPSLPAPYSIRFEENGQNFGFYGQLENGLDTPKFKFPAVVFVRIEPFQRSNQRSDWGDHPV